MDLEEMRVQTEFDAALRALVGERLGASNTERSRVMRALRGEHDEEVPLDLYVFDGDELIAGLTGCTWASWFAIENFWVHADRRGSGLGSQLLAEAERSALERGCIGARLETWDFQARPFYERHGYTVFGALDDYPPGVTEYHMAKRLDR